MAEYKTPSNSLRSKEIGTTATASAKPEERKSLQKVVQGNAQLKEKTRAEKLKETSKSAFKSVMVNTVVPHVKDTILSAIWNGLSMIFFPDGAHRPVGGSSPASRVYYGSSSYNSYGSYYGRSNPAQTEAQKIIAGTPAFRNPLLASINDANAVIDSMRAVIAQYGFATWSDLYDLCGMDTANWQGTTKYGWTSVESTMISTVTTANGQIAYELRMPKASPIDDDPF